MTAAARSETARAADVALAVLAVAAAAGVVVLVAARLRYGVDLTDEAYYSALPYRFVLGDRPFVDEMNLFQLPAMLTFPLVKAWVSISGGTAGLVLFMRVAWLAFAAGVSAAGFLFLRKLVRWPAALLASMLPLVAAPYNIPSLSYNSMGGGLLALGMVAGAWTVVLDRRRWWLVPAGVLHGLAAVAYPTLALAIPAYVAALVALGRRRAAGWLAAYLGGAAAVGALLGAAMLSAGIGAVAGDWRYMRSLAGYAGGEAKVSLVAAQAGVFFSRWPLFLVAVGVAVAVFALSRGRLRWVLLLPVAAVLAPLEWRLPQMLVMHAVILYGLAGVVLGVAVRGRPLARRLYVWGVLPALAAGLVTAYTSTNGFESAAVGLYPTLFATGALLALVLPDGSSSRATAWVTAGVSVLLLLTFGRYQYRGVYHDGPRARLTATVDAGPFAGLRTEPRTAAFEARLRSDVARYVRRGDHVLFYDGFPAGYLYSSTRPAANALWLSPAEDSLPASANATVQWWRRTGRYPDVAFRAPAGGVHGLKALDTVVTPPRFRLAQRRDGYEVWVRSAGGDLLGYLYRPTDGGTWASAR